MSDWLMLTLIGEDRPGIVAAVTDALYRHEMNLGEASMLRLGGNFTIMLMVCAPGGESAVREALAGVVQEFGLRLHVDPLSGGPRQHLVPNVQIRVHGADRAGIVAQVTARLVEHGVNILDLCSDVAGTAADPLYIMRIEGLCAGPLEPLEAALEGLRESGINVSVEPIDTLVG